MGWLGVRKKTRKPLLNRKLLVVGMLVVWLGVREKSKKATFKSRTIGGVGVGGLARR